MMTSPFKNHKENGLNKSTMVLSYASSTGLKKLKIVQKNLQETLTSAQSTSFIGEHDP